jgi:tetrahydromethanopterin S-methyltransferase subunit G
VGEYGWAIGVGIIIVAISLGRTLRVVGRALGDRVPRGPAPSSPVDPELRADVDEMRQRLAELEERVDFAERLLAKRRDSERLAPPG